jgi:hypothetical protein
MGHSRHQRDNLGQVKLRKRRGLAMLIQVLLGLPLFNQYKLLHIGLGLIYLEPGTTRLSRGEPSLLRKQGFHVFHIARIGHAEYYIVVNHMGLVPFYFFSVSGADPGP